ncbi:DNA replication licensing factor MCM8 [Hordeum vulgare]|nr:DNA replication licensing factor MCM8 [Hordeum vulgare]
MPLLMGLILVVVYSLIIALLRRIYVLFLLITIAQGTTKDVVEIMKESLYGKFGDEHGCVDFARSGGMSQQKEAKRLMSAINKQSELQQKDTFSRAVSKDLIIFTDPANKVKMKSLNLSPDAAMEEEEELEEPEVEENESDAGPERTNLTSRGQRAAEEQQRRRALRLGGKN